MKIVAIKHVRLLSMRAASLEAQIDAVIDLALILGRSAFQDFPILRRTHAASEAALNMVHQRMMNAEVEC